MPLDYFENMEHEANLERREMQHRHGQPLEWHEHRHNVLGLASWLDGFFYFASPTELLRYFEEPWKWQREYDLYHRWLHTTDTQEREACAQAAIEETTVEAILNG